MSLQRRHPDAGHCCPAKLPKGPNGRSCCRECGDEVPIGRYTFCSGACVEAWNLKSSPAAQRHAVLQRDHGICANCGRDCLALEEKFAKIRAEACRYGTDPKVLAEAWKRARRIHGWRIRLGLGTDTSLWQADHILPVCQGGGPERGQTCAEVMANLRTLCTPCHKAETRELARRRAAARKASRS